MNFTPSILESEVDYGFDPLASFEPPSQSDAGKAGGVPFREPAGRPAVTGLLYAHICPQRSSWLDDCSNSPRIDGPKKILVHRGDLHHPSVRYALGGRIVTVCPGGNLRQANKFSGGVRGKIRGFSRASRRKLLGYVNALDREGVVANQMFFTTLTYPRCWSHDWTDWKRHLRIFQKRLERAWGSIPGFWRLEFQKRGAPHFHLLLLMPEKLCSDDTVHQTLGQFRAWCASAWYEVVDSGDERHLRAGTNVELLGCWERVGYYVSKYVGKCGHNDVVAGRMWGVWHKNKLPIDWFGGETPEVVAVDLERGLRRWAKRRKDRRMYRRRQHDRCNRRYYAPAEVLERLMVWSWKKHVPHLPWAAWFRGDYQYWRLYLDRMESTYGPAKDIEGTPAWDYVETPDGCIVLSG